MSTILHISDLHRTSGPRVRNDELIGAMASDKRRWSNEGIPDPDIVVVSGDIIQGTSKPAPHDDTEIIAQYGEASDFLDRLAEKLNLDRSRVVIVPGNHDVHRNRSRNAMTRLYAIPRNIRVSAIEPNSNVRWNWDNQLPYEISDLKLYESRFEHFRKFRSDFYASVDPSPLSSNSDNVFFSYPPPIDVAIVGFSSWYGNDCYCQVGEIDSTSLDSSREMIRESKVSVAIAVWHHNVVGGPRVQDYMDERVIHRLIDFGFNIGLHGHQHYPRAAPFNINLPNLTSMVVVGAGSIAVGDHGLPMGEGRQFNIVEIDHDSRSVTVHVRAMSSSGVFVGDHRNDFGGNTYIKLSFRSDHMRSHPTSTKKLLDTAMMAVSRGEFDNALKLATDIDDQRHSFEIRQIKKEALSGLGRSGDLLDLLDPPQSADELAMAIRLLLDDRRFDDASRRLEANHELLSQEILDTLRKDIGIRRML